MENIAGREFGLENFRMRSVTYQLALQLPASSIKDYDAMIELEETIMSSLGNLGKVDGHDAGSGEMNISSSLSTRNSLLSA